MHLESESDGDPRYHLPAGTPLITPERASKGDVFTGPPCKDCDSSGKSKDKGAAHTALCRSCRGKGWVGSSNAEEYVVTSTDNGSSQWVENSSIRFAQVQVRNILNFLWTAGIITDEENDHGHTFQAWRDQHRVALGLERPISNELDEPVTLKLRAYGFVLLLRRMSEYDSKAINKSLDVLANRGTELEAKREERPYRAAFMNLSKAIVPIKEKISYLEKASEEERNLLADEQLKKFLDDIHKRR
jgi:hypothetical protein